ncbi:hypothetical protein VNI00_007591 [Paramarasmius palmivorus]|uniref:Uncharacterized protein n=1 Tax=Paramarasmius palmivorus TaxID=297713 RepID=A0AAW0D619_9AGAR
MENTSTPSASNSEFLSATTTPEIQPISGTDTDDPAPPTTPLPPPRTGACRRPQPQPSNTHPETETLYIIVAILGLIILFLAIMAIYAWRRLRQLTKEDACKGFDKHRMVKLRKGDGQRQGDGQGEENSVGVNVEGGVKVDVSTFRTSDSDSDLTVGSSSCYV